MPVVATISTVETILSPKFDHKTSYIDNSPPSPSYYSQSPVKGVVSQNFQRFCRNQTRLKLDWNP